MIKTFIDTLSCTGVFLLSEEQRERMNPENLDTSKYLREIIYKYATITNKPITPKSKISFYEYFNWLFSKWGIEVLYSEGGKNGYKYSYPLVATDRGKFRHRLGFIAFGGNLNKARQETWQLYLNGHGMSYLHENEYHNDVFNFIEQMEMTIKRLDIAVDDFDGIYPIERMIEAYDAQKFRNHRVSGRYPVITQVGDFHTGNDTKGRTLYVGSRTSSKYFRCYEKGKQLGDAKSNWVRHEIELKASKILIPYDALKSPTGYFVGCYEVLADIVRDVCEDEESIDVKEVRIKCKKKVLECSIEHMKKNCKKSYGKFIWAYLEIGGNVEDLMIQEVPKRLAVA